MLPDIVVHALNLNLDSAEAQRQLRCNRNFTFENGMKSFIFPTHFSSFLENKWCVNLIICFLECMQMLVCMRGTMQYILNREAKYKYRSLWWIKNSGFLKSGLIKQTICCFASRTRWGLVFFLSDLIVLENRSLLGERKMGILNSVFLWQVD